MVSGCPCVASCSSPPGQLGPAGGMEEPLVARSVHASSLLSPRFILGLGIRELLSCGGLLLPVLFWLVLPPHLCTLGEVLGRENLRVFFLCSRLPLPPHLCTLGEVVWRVGLPGAAPVRVLPGLPIFSLGSPGGGGGGYFESAVGWMALVCDLVVHTVAPLAVLGSWVVSFAVFPCVGVVRSLAVYGSLTVSQRSL